MVQVVIADGDRDLRSGIAGALADAGYPVLEAGTGLSTLNVMAASKEQPLVVVMDAHLPDLDGWEIVRFARTALNAKEDGRLAVVMMTRDAAADGAGGSAGAVPDGDMVPLLVKPFALDELLGAVRDAERRLDG